MTEAAALLGIFSTSFVVGLSGAAAPGPLLAYTIARAARQGLWAGPLISLGHALLELVVVLALALGLGTLLQRPTVGAVVGIAGGLFLVWMSYSLLRMPAVQTLSTERQTGATPILAGIAVSLSNPFWFLWWITLGSAFLAWSLERGPAGLVSFYTGHISSDFVWYGLVALLVGRGRSLLDQRWYRMLLRVCGLFLLGLGVWFVVWGIGRVA